MEKKKLKWEWKILFGVDYEDYVGLQLGLPDEDEIEIEYPVGVWFLLLMGMVVALIVS